MSYIPSDFDDADDGFNLLNVRELNEGLVTVEGGFTDKGLGYKQKYSIYGNFPLSFYHNTLIDFYFIFKNDIVYSSNFSLNLRTKLSNDTIYDEINLKNVTHTVTQDSSGNLVWLFEDFDFSSLSVFNDLIYAGTEFRITIEYFDNIAGRGFNYRLTSFKSTNPMFPDDENDIVLKYIELSTINNFTISRKDNISELMEVEFSGTFDNQFLGAVDNTVKQITLFYINPNTQEMTQKVLEKDVDYKVVGNTFYSGNGNSMQPTDINIEEMYYQGMTFTLDVETWIDIIDDTDETYDNEPVFNWGRDNNTKFLNVNGEIRVNNEKIETLSSTVLYEGNTTSSITLSDDIENYKKIDVIVKGTNNIYSTYTIYNPAGKLFELRTGNIEITSGFYIFVACAFTINGKNAVRNSSYDRRIVLKHNTSITVDNDISYYKLYVTKIIGYK